jgi:hypothetical protein
MSRPHAAPCLCVACLVAVMPPPSERRAHPDVRRVFRAEPLGEGELNRIVPTLRAPLVRRKDRRR